MVHLRHVDDALGQVAFQRREGAVLHRHPHRAARVDEQDAARPVPVGRAAVLSAGDLAGRIGAIDPEEDVGSNWMGQSQLSNKENRHQKAPDDSIP